MAGTGTPNLDDCPSEELLEFIRWADRDPGALSVTLWGDGHAAPLVMVGKLKRYAKLRHLAAIQRRYGKIQKAIDAEFEMQRIYNSLHSYAKW